MPPTISSKIVRARTPGKGQAAQLTAVGLTVSYDTSSNTATVNLRGKHVVPEGRRPHREHGGRQCHRASRSGEATRSRSHREARISAPRDGARMTNVLGVLSPGARPRNLPSVGVLNARDLENLLLGCNTIRAKGVI